MTTKNPKKQKTSDYKEFLFKRLEDPAMAAGYLTASFEEGEEAFLLAVKDVAEACGGIAPLAKKTRLNREGLYDMLSEKGNPRLSSLSAVMNALGMKLEFVPRLHRTKAA
jgi:probable addiction module antidote protein